jgi:hypothetical protein
MELTNTVRLGRLISFEMLVRESVVMEGRERLGCQQVHSTTPKGREAPRARGPSSPEGARLGCGLVGNVARAVVGLGPCKPSAVHEQDEQLQ